MKGKRSGFLMLVLGVVLALVVGLLVFSVTQRATQPEVPSTDVVVAIQDIPDRSVIQASAIGVKKMPIDFVPAGAITKPEQAIGKMTPTKIYIGETILTAKLVDTKGQSGLSFVLDKGRVLITFPASNIIGLGVVHPGDTVDLVVTYKAGKGRTPTQAQGLAELLVPSVTQFTTQNLKVVTIGGPSQPGQQQTAPATFVTFAVEPQDALFLKAMKDSEELVIEMVLRAAGDNEIFRTEPVTVKSVIDRYGVRAP